MAGFSQYTAGSVLGGNSEQEWQEILQSLKHGQYDRAETFLLRMQQMVDCSEHPDLRILLTTAALLCLTCSKFKSQAEGYQSSYQDALKREQQLQRELCELFKLIMKWHLSHSCGSEETAYESLLNTGTIPNNRRQVPVLKQVFQKLLGIDKAKLPPNQIELLPAVLALNEADTDKRTTVVETQLTVQPPPVSLFVFCLGKFQIYLEGQIVGNWPGSKGKSIFKYLVTHRELPVDKEVLMDLFWPDAPPESARRNLNWAIHNLRQILHRNQPGESHVMFEDECYFLNPDLRIWIDVEEFEERIRRAHALEESQDITQSIHEYQAAELLYHGEFLEEDRYEGWVQPKRQSVQNAYLYLLDRLGSFCYERQHFDDCINLCNKILVADSCREEAHVRLMQCYYRQGYQYLAIRQYQACVDKLKTELDVAPSKLEILEPAGTHGPSNIVSANASFNVKVTFEGSKEFWVAMTNMHATYETNFFVEGIGANAPEFDLGTVTGAMAEGQNTYEVTLSVPQGIPTRGVYQAACLVRFPQYLQVGGVNDPLILLTVI